MGNLLQGVMDGIPFYFRSGDYSAMDMWIAAEVEREYMWDRLADIHAAVDLGGHLGFWTLRLKHHFPDARVVVVEVDADNYEILKLNTEPLLSVKPIHARCGYTDGDYVVARHTFNGGGHVVVPRTEFDEHLAQRGDRVLVEVTKTITLEDAISMLDADTVDIVKIDVEGHEAQIFASCDDTTMDRIRMFIGEIHYPIDTFHALTNNRLARHGFKPEYHSVSNREQRYMFIAER